MKTTTQRITWLDNAKAIAVILVVAVHFVQSYCPDLIVVQKIIFSFKLLSMKNSKAAVLQKIIL